MGNKEEDEEIKTTLSPNESVVQSLAQPFADSDGIRKKKNRKADSSQGQPINPILATIGGGPSS